MRPASGRVRIVRDVETMKHEHEHTHYSDGCEAARSTDDELHALLVTFVARELSHRMAVGSPDDTAGITRRYIDLWCQLRSSDALQRIARLPESLVQAVRDSVLSLRDEGVIDRLVESIEAGLGIAGRSRAPEEHS